MMNLPTWIAPDVTCVVVEFEGTNLVRVTRGVTITDRDATTLQTRPAVAQGDGIILGDEPDVDLVGRDVFKREPNKWNNHTLVFLHPEEDREIVDWAMSAGRVVVAVHMLRKAVREVEDVASDVASGGDPVRAMEGVESVVGDLRTAVEAFARARRQG